MQMTWQLYLIILSNYAFQGLITIVFNLTNNWSKYGSLFSIKSNSFMSSIYFFRPDVLHKLHTRDSSSALVFRDMSFYAEKKVTYLQKHRTSFYF